MSKGVALQFRRRFPDMFRAYENAEAAADPELAAELVGAWNARKHRMMGPDHVAKAWSHLRDERWLTSSAPAGPR